MELQPADEKRADGFGVQLDKMKAVEFQLAIKVMGYQLGGGI